MLCIKMYWTSAKMLLLADVGEYSFANAETINRVIQIMFSEGIHGTFNVFMLQKGWCYINTDNLKNKIVTWKIVSDQDDNI